MMTVVEQGLVPIYEYEGERAVNARDLHEFLQVGRDFSTWIKEKLEKNGFVAGADFSPIPGKSGGGRPTTEYALSLDVAKELAMLEGNDRGRQVRRYFIDCERRMAAKPVSTLQALVQTVAVLQQQDQRIKQLEETTTVIKETILAKPENWRKEILHMFTRAAKAAGGGDQYSLLRKQSYDMLEDRAHVDLSIRVKNRRDRAAGQGLPLTRINEITPLDVIEDDPKLREIYTAIIKDMVIKYAA